MKGILVTNHFLSGKKFDDLVLFFMKSAQRHGITLTHYTNCQMINLLSLPYAAARESLAREEADFVLFWDKDVRLAAYLEALGARVFNSSRAIEICDDKSLMYLSLCQSGIPMPKTAFSPMMFYTPKDFPPDYPDNFISSLEKELSYPIVVKECFGSFGYQVYLAKDRDSLAKLIRELSPKPLIFQEFITTVKHGIGGRDLRLHVVGDRVVTAMARENPRDFRANITNGGIMSLYSPSDEEKETALKACRKIGLDFAGVDLLVDTQGRVFLCEVNSNAHFVNIFSCTGVNVADCIIEHIANNVNINNK